MISAWIQGVVLGLGVAMPIGPVNIEIIRRHLTRGFAAGLLLGLGACSVDTGYIVVISLGLITARPGPQVQAALTVVGAAILLVLAGMVLRSARSSARQAAEQAAGAHASPLGPGATQPPRWRHYVVGVAMTAVNPMNIVFWFGVIVSGTSGSAGGVLGPWPTVVGVMCGTVAWVTGLNLLLMAGRRSIRPRVLTAINVASAGVLAAMAGWSVWRL